MGTPKIKSFKKIIPMIYAYTTPNDISHQGWTKIGYTDKQSVEERIKQQSHTIDAKVELLWRGNARYQDGSDETFTDHEFHNYLTTKKKLNASLKRNGSILMELLLTNTFINLLNATLATFKVKREHSIN